MKIKMQLLKLFTFLSITQASAFKRKMPKVAIFSKTTDSQKLKESKFDISCLEERKKLIDYLNLNNLIFRIKTEDIASLLKPRPHQFGFEDKSYMFAATFDFQNTLLFSRHTRKRSSDLLNVLELKKPVDQQFEALYEIYYFRMENLKKRKQLINFNLSIFQDNFYIPAFYEEEYLKNFASNGHYTEQENDLETVQDAFILSSEKENLIKQPSESFENTKKYLVNFYNKHAKDAAFYIDYAIEMIPVDENFQKLERLRLLWKFITLLCEQSCDLNEPEKSFRKFNVPNEHKKLTWLHFLRHFNNVLDRLFSLDTIDGHVNKFSFDAIAVQTFQLLSISKIATFGQKDINLESLKLGLKSEKNKFKTMDLIAKNQLESFCKQRQYESIHACAVMFTAICIQKDDLLKSKKLPIESTILNDYFETSKTFLEVYCFLINLACNPLKISEKLSLNIMRPNFDYIQNNYEKILKNFKSSQSNDLKLIKNEFQFISNGVITESESLEKIYTQLATRIVKLAEEPINFVKEMNFVVLDDCDSLQNYLTIAAKNYQNCRPNGNDIDEMAKYCNFIQKARFYIAKRDKEQKFIGIGQPEWTQHLLSSFGIDSLRSSDYFESSA